jgi:hypothetical protein
LEIFEKAQRIAAIQLEKENGEETNIFKKFLVTLWNKRNKQGQK